MENSALNNPAPNADDLGRSRALQCLKSVLTANETLEACAIQRRLFALTHRRLIVAATSGRLVALSRTLLGGFDVHDLRWQDLREVHLHVGILAATLRLTAYTSPDLASTPTPLRSFVLSGLCRQQAEALYRLCQAHDQMWREKRRVRELEEMRARAGGVQLGMTAGSPIASAVAAANGIDEPTARLRSAKSMLDAGLITDVEYESIKARIINTV